MKIQYYTFLENFDWADKLGRNYCNGRLRTLTIGHSTVVPSPSCAKLEKYKNKKIE